MDTMKAVVYDRPGKFEVRQIALSEPGAGEVLLRVLVAGVCGTDLHLHHGEFGPTYPLIPGHEIVGEVVAAGPGVTDVRVGEQVTLDNTASCGRCVECRRARPAHCLHLVAQGVNAPGGFAEFVVTDADRCFNVDDLDPEVAVLAEPTACVVHGMDVGTASRIQCAAVRCRSDLFRRELTIKGSFAQQFSFDRALAYLRSGRVDTTGMVTGSRSTTTRGR